MASDAKKFDPILPNIVQGMSEVSLRLGRLEAILSRRKRDLPETFCLDFATAQPVTQVCGGVIKYLHNPNAGAVTLTLVDFRNRRILWAGVLAAGDAPGLYAPFHGGIDCTSIAGIPSGGLPIIVAGDYDSNE